MTCGSRVMFRSKGPKAAGPDYGCKCSLSEGGRFVNIYVGNLSYQASDDDLRQAFETHGQVSSAQVIRDKFTGRSRGFGFVEMPNNEEAQKAIDSLNNEEIAGRPVRVNEARPREDRPARS